MSKNPKPLFFDYNGEAINLNRVGAYYYNIHPTRNGKYCIYFSLNKEGGTRSHCFDTAQKAKQVYSQINALVGCVDIKSD